MWITTTRMMWEILQQHKEFALTCEEGIFVPETQSTLSKPQIVWIGSISMGN
jgi:hypothetical protein